MDEGLLHDAIPVLIAAAYIHFVCASILTAVKPPQGSGEKREPAIYPRWRYLDAGPEGIRKNLNLEFRPRSKPVS